MANTLFGTDGVRGVANTELTCELAFALGAAAARVLGPRIMIGRDTRTSGHMLESSLLAGIMSEGGTPYCAGIIPTPAVALLTRELELDGGCVISASHNPPQYNGIKFFSPQGTKLSDELEDALAREASQERKSNPEDRVTGSKVGMIHKVKNARHRYVDHSIAQLADQGLDLTGLTIALDCAHGAAIKTTPEALERLGAQVIAINTSYTGDDINVNCGSTHLDEVKRLVAEHQADVGIAHDGDADRVLMVDHTQAEIDGDAMIAIVALDLKERGLLVHDTVVSTVMCNLGFTKAMREHGIEVIQAKVGDRFVKEAMNETGAVLGGEQSGHIIYTPGNSTGDGLLSALLVLSVMRRTGKSLRELSQVMQRYPQCLVNVPVSDRTALDGHTAIWTAVAQQEAALGEDGRILVRASGTEPLVRVMVEASTQDKAQGIAEELARVIEDEIGV